MTQHHPSAETDDLKKALEQRADYIPYEELMKGTAINDFFESVHEALTERGTKLIVGPRGCGKTHMMRYTWVKCRDDRTAPFAVYVTFNRYYRLEPLLKARARAGAIDLFHAWVLARILLELAAASDSFPRLLIPAVTTEELLGFDQDALKQLVAKLERSQGLTANEETLVSDLSIDRVAQTITRIAESSGRKRTILLLDDAALTLTPEYLVEFFDIVRAVKTPYISPKASVYPGTTEYGPRFHATQEGDLVPLWLDVEDESYSAVMGAIAELRYDEFSKVPEDISEYLKFAAFGIPRAYLRMLYEFGRGGFTTTQQGLNQVIQSHISARIAEYKSLSVKAPKLATLITRGEAVFRYFVKELRTANRELLARNEKQLTIGLSGTESSVMVVRLFDLLIEAGLLFKHQHVSHGPDRSYERFTPHLAALFESRVFSGAERGTSPRQIVETLRFRNSKHPLRRSVSSLQAVGELSDLRFDLPPCAKCDVARITESQRFCHNCGSELLDASTFSECMALPLAEIPGLTQWQKDRIGTELPQLKTIGELLAHQDPGTELRKIHRVGQRRASRILEVVEGYVDEFLS